MQAIAKNRLNYVCLFSPIGGHLHSKCGEVLPSISCWAGGVLAPGPPGAWRGRGGNRGDAFGSRLALSAVAGNPRKSEEIIGFPLSVLHFLVNYLSIISVRCAQNPPPCFLFWWWQTSGGTQKSTKNKSQNNCKKRDGRQVSERKKQPKIHQKTLKNH